MDEVHGFWGWEGHALWMFASRIPKGMYLTDIEARELARGRVEPTIRFLLQAP